MRHLILTLSIILFTFSSAAQARPSQLPVPRVAPEWSVSEWINSSALQLSDLKGKVVVIDFFQLWCPGCNAFSIPLMHKWEQDFATEASQGKIQFVSIHTVFEGFDYQNPAKLKQFLRRKRIHHPVGVDRAIPGDRIPQTMRLFRTSGTPEMAIIDKKGIIRFQEFGGFNFQPVERLIRRLILE